MRDGNCGARQKLGAARGGQRTLQPARMVGRCARRRWAPSTYAPAAPDEFAGQLTIGSKWQDSENITVLVESVGGPASAVVGDCP
ncbi:hypothetical protein [Rhodococcus sp. MEB064]|uniref:hypothetical protein n=1 Tax=Rhodococcus sp. MEB064 TaxID=1587522 RepID=UPI0005ACA34B|nr:hypothetical protein RU01_07530 [Rhodococcus sp. MEB064]